eukprot:6824560-Karenia_brevis.AAC.1
MSERCLAEASDKAYGVSFPLSLVWPPSKDTLPNLALVALAAWVVVAIAMVSKESDIEKTYQRKRVLQ